MAEEIANCTFCRHPLDANGHCPHCDEVAHVWTLKDWRPLLTLALMIILGFSFTRLIVTLFKGWQDALATEYYQAGVRAMDAHRASEAVDDLETALVYSRDNFQYRLKLTDALLASGATGEAMSQLRAFWEQRPGDAQVNLKLARLEAARSCPEDAIRFYENAIDGVWPERTDPAPQRIGARFEESQYLISLNRPQQAEAALLALAALLPESAPEQSRLGELFLRNGDADDSLKAYEAALQMEKRRLHSRSESALAAREGTIARWNELNLGAARASLALGDFKSTRRYLGELSPKPDEAQAMLAKLERMNVLDPFAEELKPHLRRQRIVADFHIAEDRLSACGIPSGTSSAAAVSAQLGQLANWASRLDPMMDERKLQGRDDVIESAMRFVFQAEAATQSVCGKPSADDEALILLARKRLGDTQ